SPTMTRSRTRTLRAQNWPNRIAAARGAARNGSPIVPTIAVQAKKAKLNARALVQIIVLSRLGRIPEQTPVAAARERAGARLLDISRIRSPTVLRCRAKPTNVPA